MGEGVEGIVGGGEGGPEGCGALLPQQVRGLLVVGGCLGGGERAEAEETTAFARHGGRRATVLSAVLADHMQHGSWDVSWEGARGEGRGRR